MKLQKQLTFIISIGIIFLLETVHAQTTTWKVDPSHSSIGFSIDHLVISETVGQFNEYTVLLTADQPDFTDANFEVEIQTKSIDTKSEKRDEHLRNGDFFDVEKHPTITFKSKKFEKITDTKYTLSGKLTLNGITRDVTFEAQFRGIIKDPWGGTRAGLKLWGTIDRYDYNLKYNSVMEAGGLSIGKEVRLECRMEFIKG